MAHTSLRLIPGVDQNRTLALNEAAISTSNLIRFVPDKENIGLPQKLGGWTKFFSNSIGSIVRSLWAWEDINSRSWLAAGAESSLNVIEGGGLAIITPQTSTANVAVSFATTAGSSVVTINATGSGLDAYDAVEIMTQVSVGGLILFGVYPVIPINANQFQIIARDVLGNPQYATFSTVTKTVTGGSWATGTATLTYAASYTYQAGDIITVTGVSPSGYNGTFVVTGSTTTSVSYALAANPGAWVSGGSITNGGSVPLYSTTSGSASINVELNNHGFQAGDTFPALVSTTVGGITIHGNYTVISVTSSSVFVITGANTASATVSLSGENGGNARFVYYNGIGPVAANAGYGVGGYGTGGYGSGVVTASSSATPITTTDWTLDNWGETLIANPLNGGIYQWSPSNNTPVATIIPQAPQINAGSLVAMPQRQIIAWGSTFNGIQDQLLIRWSEVNDYSVWAAQITNQAGSYRIPKGSRIVQCIQGPQQTLVWTDLGLWAMQYVGPPYVYQFNEIGTGCGLIGRKAAASMGGVVYWMGQSQFFRLSGGGVEAIPCPIWDVIFQDIDRNNLDKIRVAPNSRFGEITWYYPTTGNGGEVSHYVKYNVVLNQWDFGTLGRTAWINESVLGPPIGADPNTYIYQHETSTDADGLAMNSSFQTGYFAMTEAEVKMFVDQIWPDMKWGYYGGSQNAVVKITFYVTDYAGQTPKQFGPYSVTQATTFVTPRFRGRLVSIKVESNDIGSFWRIGKIRYRVIPDGKF